MMTADKEEISLGHNTMMCGDSKVWLQMRVTYSRELKVKAELNRLAKLVVTTDTSNKDNEDELCKYVVGNEHEERMCLRYALRRVGKEIWFCSNDYFIKLLCL
jgi:hypothetical protein